MIYAVLNLLYQTQNIMSEVIENPEVTQKLEAHFQKVAEANGEVYVPRFTKEEGQEEKSNSDTKKGEEEGKKPKTETPTEELPADKLEKPVIADADSILKQLKELGVEASSLDELKELTKPKHIEPTAEEIALRKLEIDKWAIQNKKVTPEKLEAYKNDSQLSKLELAFKVYQKQRANENNESTGEPFTEEELRSEFEVENLLYSEDTDTAKKRAIEKLELVADTYLFNEYKELTQMESEYIQESSNITSQKHLTGIAEVVKENIIKDGISFQINDDSNAPLNVNIPISKSALSSINLSLNDVTGTADIEAVRKALVDNYILNNQQKVFSEIAKTYHANQLKALKARGIGIETRLAEFEQTVTELSPEMKGLLERTGHKN